MTPEQQRLVQYADVMRWSPARRGAAFPRWNFPDFENGLRVWRKSQTNGQIWNPLTDANDALELAEQMNVFHGRDYDGYWSFIDTHGGVMRGDTLPAAICAAVDAILAKKPVETLPES